MKRLCKVDGYIIFYVPKVWEQHDYPGDFWRFNEDVLLGIFSDYSVIKLDEVVSGPDSKCVGMFAQKIYQDERVDLSLICLREVSESGIE